MTIVDEEPEVEATYALEREVKCPSCRGTVQTLHVVRALRTQVNFTSSLPRRGHAILCPACGTVLAATIGSRAL
jgi:ribosomal protein S27E